MNKKRMTLFGYRIKDGRIIINPTEADIVKFVFSEYLNGVSFKTISETLTSKSVNYLNGKSSWNKNRVKRIIEDIRYTGLGEYAQIITEDVYNKANKLKSEKSTYRPNDTVAPHLRKLLYCQKCGGKLYHKTGSTGWIRWQCNTENCNLNYRLNDSLINEMLNSANELVKSYKLSDYEKPVFNADISIMNDEIYSQIDNSEMETSDVIKLTMKCAVEKYSQLNAVFSEEQPEKLLYKLLFDDDYTINILFKTNHILIYKLVRSE